MTEDSPKDRAENEQPDTAVSQVAAIKHGMRQMRSFLKEAAALMDQELSQVEEIKRILEEVTARTEAELRIKEEALARKDSDLKELNERLTVQLRDLEKRIKEKEAIIEIRNAELEVLKSKWSSPPVDPELDIILKDLEEGVLSEEKEEGSDVAEEIAAAKKVKVFERSLRDIVIKRGKIVKIGTGHGPKKARLTTLLAPTQKRAS